MAPRDDLSPRFEHPDFWVFDKPAGASFHSEAGTGFFAELQAALPTESLFPVHRLDKITSGLLLIARNKEAAATFQVLLSQRDIQKTYLALSDLKPSKKQGWIKGDMQKTRNGSWKLSRELSKPAVTQFHSVSLQEKLRLFVLQPYTGRTHQLRVAMKSLGCPILGDTRYGGSTADRGYLHAAILQFDWHGERLCFQSLPASGELFQQHKAAIERELTALCQ